MKTAYPARTTMLVAALALLAAASCRQGVAQVQEGDLKAAYVYNFAVFTTWPADAALQKLPFVVCASTEGALWAGLRALDGKLVNGRSWSTADLVHPKGGRCDIAVLPPGVERPAAQLAGALVVRNGAGSATANGPAAITLIDDEEHIRFDIDTREAARNGLRFSSRLLRLARNIQ
jgi:hypothetical protein